MQQDKVVKLILSNELKSLNLPDAFKAALESELTVSNPKWHENNRMKRSNRSTSKNLYGYKQIGTTGLSLPRGCTRLLITKCIKANVEYKLIDTRRNFPQIDFKATGSLSMGQTEALKQMMKKDFGTLQVDDSQKELVALNLVARRAQPTLIVVYKKDMVQKWAISIETILGIDKNDIGLIGLGKKETGDKITIAMIQTLSKCAVDISKKVGHLVVDDCARVPLNSFMSVVSAFDCRYMLGLSSAAWRKDQLANFIFWHLGDVYCRVV